MPDVDGVLHEMGKWKYMVIADLLKSFYQIPLAISSMKYCGVVTPFKGIRVYTRSAMGMPGSETCLKELMSRVLGDLIQEGCVAKIADNLYVGGNSPTEFLDNWRRVLTLLQKNNRSITIPQLQDALWIVTDGCVKNRGSAATLYVHQNGSLLLAGFFSAKLCKHQVTCLPCEIKALAVGTAIRHFAPYIMQSPHTSEVLTDSRPCVQAYEKLKRGEFSASSRVTTLSTVSCYSVHISHIAGVENLPPDYAS